MALDLLALWFFWPALKLSALSLYAMRYGRNSMSSVIKLVIFFVIGLLVCMVYISYYYEKNYAIQKPLPATESVMLINSSKETRANDKSKYLNWAISETDKEIVINFQCSVKEPRR